MRYGWLLAAWIAGATAPSAASEFSVLHSFSRGDDGLYPSSTMAIDDQGTLYGSTLVGGAKGGGTLFRLGTDGYSILHTFDGFDGSTPAGKLLLDADGSLWGTTWDGGSGSLPGTAFRLDASGHLLSAPMVDGSYPYAGLTRGPDGNFYGVTTSGGEANLGTVFKLDPSSFVIATIHAFHGHDGSAPEGTLLFTDGKLVGTAATGGKGGRGTAFALNADGSGFARQRTLKGGGLVCGLALDASGRAWGVASVDKPLGAGEGTGGIYTIDADGQVTIAHRFAADGLEGYRSYGELLLGRDGWLYGMTVIGGAFSNGTIFRFNPADSAFEVLHDFAGGADDGAQPSAGLTQDAAGVLYGVTGSGGAFGAGIVFQFVP